jgi:hypothetical protein
MQHKLCWIYSNMQLPQFRCCCLLQLLLLLHSMLQHAMHSACNAAQYMQLNVLIWFRSITANIAV